MPSDDPDSTPWRPVSRREFGRLAAALGTAAAVPGRALATLDADQSDPELGERLRYAYEQAPRRRLPTLVIGADADTLEDLADLDATDELRTRTDPRPAAYARLTREGIDAVRDVDGVERLELSPGANPFWRVRGYDDGVFPEPSAAVDFVGYEELLVGLAELADRHPDRLRLRRAGTSPGTTDHREGGVTAHPLVVAEVSEGVRDPEALADRETALVVCGIHGDERGGVEAGARAIEGLVTGTDPGARHLDAVRLAFVFPNPDGWVARTPDYDVRGQNGYGSDERDVFHRGTGTNVDPNRQYPTVGWIHAGFYPAEPLGVDYTGDWPPEPESGAAVDYTDGPRVPDFDLDVPDRIRRTVPDALSLVDFCREYDDLGYALDLHGMFGSETFLEGLTMNAQHDARTEAELQDLHEHIGEAVEDALGPSLSVRQSDLERVVGETYPGSPVPTSAYGHGTIHDRIGYVTTGAFASWLADPPEQGGTGATALALELSLDNSGRNRARRTFRPWLVDLQVDTLRSVVRVLAERATVEVTPQVHSGDGTAVYVTSPGVERSSDGSPPTSATAAEPVSQAGTSVSPAESTASRTLAPGAVQRVTLWAPEGGTLVATVDADAPVEVTLGAPDGTVARSEQIDPATRTFQHGRDLAVADTRAGRWTVAVRNVAVRRNAVRLSGVTVEPDGAPTTQQSLGYGQRAFDASPFEFLADYDDAIVDGGVLAPATVERAKAGALDGADAVVVTHDDGSQDDRYRAAVARVLDDGGTLLLTDAGLTLLGALDWGPIGAIEPSDVGSVQRRFAVLQGRKDSHPLLADTRPAQRELWTAPPLGYTPGRDSPVYRVDADAFRAAGGTVAATADGDVIVGTFEGRNGTVHVVGSLLPPASTVTLHPFGLADHAVTDLGRQVVANALGHERHRSTGE